MNTICIADAKKNLHKLVNDVNVGFNPITIINNKGNNAVLISEEEWNNIEETLYLYNIPGYLDKIKDIEKEQDWSNSSKYDPDEEW